MTIISIRLKFLIEPSFLAIPVVSGYLFRLQEPLALEVSVAECYTSDGGDVVCIQLDLLGSQQVLVDVLLVRRLRQHRDPTGHTPAKGNL